MMRYLPAVFSFILLFFLLFTVPAAAVSLKVTWTANTDKDLAGYRIYIGLKPNVYAKQIDAGKTTMYLINGVAAGKTYYVAVSAYDASNNESMRSTEVVVPVPLTQTASILLSAPPDGSLFSAGPVLAWSPIGCTIVRYTVYASINNGTNWYAIYSGSSPSCTMSSVWGFIPSKAKVLWYVLGKSSTGASIKSRTGTFSKQ